MTYLIKRGIGFVMLLFFVACQSDRPNSELYQQGSDRVLVDAFDKTIELQAYLDTVEIATELLKVRKLVTSNEYLFALCADPDTLIRVFDNSTLAYLGGFGFEGEGPGELEFFMINASSIGVQNNELFVTDRNYFRSISLANFKADLMNNKVKVVSRVRVPGNFRPANNAFKRSDGNIYGRLTSSRKHLSVLNTDDLNITDTLDFPNLRPKVPASAWHHLYMSDITPSPDARKVAIGYRMFPLIRTYDFQKDTYLRVDIKSKNPQVSDIPVAPNGRSVDSSNLFGYYVKLVVSNSYIVGLYKENRSQITNGKWLRIPLDKAKLHVLDWSGKGIAELTIPEWVNVFEITPDGQYLIFFHPEEAERLYRFRLASFI